MAWFIKKSPEEKEVQLDPVSVEKWFGYNCSVIVEDSRPVASNEIQAATPVLTIDFIQGASETINRLANGAYQWKQIVFHSKQLDDALKQLPEIQAAGPDGRANPVTSE
jgi:hypothetical protein